MTYYNNSSALIRLAFCTLGICFCYGFYGYLQEKIVSQSNLGATFILVTQTMANIFVAILWHVMAGGSSDKRDEAMTKTTTKGNATTPQLNHTLLAITSVTYVIAMTASNESLRFVSYPTAVLAKSCKMIPTMITGWAIEKRKYDLKKWIAALLISVGIAIFNLSRIKSSVSAGHDSSVGDRNTDDYWKGMLLLVTSLTMDGLLGACQGFVKRTDINGRAQRPPTAVETMLYINLYALLLLVPMSVAASQWNEGIQILLHDHELFKSIVILNAVVAIGQIFIFLTITWYSSLVCTTITTTRKFFTILFSVLHFGHRFSNWQWISVCMVFSGLYLSTATKGKKPTTDGIAKKVD